MHVLCTNCEASYDVDAILVPTKGVPLRCARCETVFRVEPEYPVPAGQPEWVLHDRGESRPIMTMGELQRLIRSGEVTRDAELDRIAVGKRRLHEIPELLSFFPEPIEAGMQDRTTQKHRVVASSMPPPLTRKSTAPSKGDATGDLILGQERLISRPPSESAPPSDRPSRTGSTLRPLQLREEQTSAGRPGPAAKRPNFSLWIGVALASVVASVSLYFWAQSTTSPTTPANAVVQTTTRQAVAAAPPARTETIAAAVPTTAPTPPAMTPPAMTEAGAVAVAPESHRSSDGSDSFDGLVRDARAALERGDLRRAEEKISAADGARPNRPEVTTLRGYLALERGDQPRALRYFREAGDYGDALVGKAEVERNLHQEGDARATYQRYLALYPQGASASLAQRQLERLGAFAPAAPNPSAAADPPAPENPDPPAVTPESVQQEDHAEEPNPYQRLD